MSSAKWGYIELAVFRNLIVIALTVLWTACGEVPGPVRSTSITASQALTGTAEWLEFETPAVRAQLFRDVARQSQEQAGQAGAVLFPHLVGEDFVAARGIDSKYDLLSAPDGGAAIFLNFEDRGERFSEDRRDAFQGLSEREAAELVARSLLNHWKMSPAEPVSVIRSAGAPYAAAWRNGELRINPAFVYMAAAQQ